LLIGAGNTDSCDHFFSGDTIFISEKCNATGIKLVIACLASGSRFVVIHRYAEYFQKSALPPTNDDYKKLKDARSGLLIRKRLQR
jgi:hypothetical protein